MESRIDYALMKAILNCRECKNQTDITRHFPDDCLPVCCFGDPLGKKVFVVGINPSKAEYGSGYLERDVGKALESQMTYFDRREYRFFEEIARFFDDDVITTKLGIVKSLWEQVGYLDLVKCVTAKNNEQWNGLKASEKRAIIENCQVFLERQLGLYQPRLIIAYGKDVGMWFGVKDSDKEEFNIIPSHRKLGFQYEVIYVPQRQGKHSRPEVNEVKEKIKKALASARYA